MKKPKSVTVGTRITEPFAKILEEYVRRGAYVNLADLLRGALREKIRRDAPDLMENLHVETEGPVNE